MGQLARPLLIEASESDSVIFAASESDSMLFEAPPPPFALLRAPPPRGRHALALMEGVAFRSLHLCKALLSETTRTDHSANELRQFSPSGEMPSAKYSARQWGVPNNHGVAS
jgi:hypothetical protein